MARKQQPRKKPSLKNNDVIPTPVTEVTPQVKEVVQPKETKKSSNNWEIKDRVYLLKRGLSPLSYAIKSANIFWFDEEKGYEREMKYTRNQKTPFIDEFPEGSQARLEHIVFEDGSLYVPKEKQTLQKLLSLYHPDLNKKYEEYDAVQEAVDEVSILELEVEALMAAKETDIDMAEAIMRVELGSKVSEMSSKELKRDLLLFAKKNPSLFLELANDENVHLRNIGIRATEQRIIKLSNDNRHFSWASNDRKLMTVPFDEHPYSALAAWFKTDEGMEVFNSIEKRLK
ncbi:MAG: hypothetical protein EBY39_08915 [Flavobacteriia bacterium]|nr:hypothetical protein [Flavobacteriia bacterium]